jgi:DNA-binding response OmpR family regulator
VCQLRKKLDTIGLTNAIATVRRFGYALGTGPAR